MSAQQNSQIAHPNSSLLYFTPAEIGANLVEFTQRKSTGSGLKWGTARMNYRILPLDDGQIGAVVALPGAGKTTLGVSLAREYAIELRENGVKNKAILYVTVDQTVEDIACMAMASKEHTVTDFAEGKVTQEVAQKLAREFVELPFYISGKSIMDRRPSQPRLTFPNIERGILEMERHVHCKPALIVIDYIQNMPIEKTTSKRMEQVTEAMIGCRELSLSVPCPILILAQASRESRDRELKIPTPQESQHASVIEQEADVWLGMWRPCLTELDKKMVRFSGKEIPISENLVFLGLGKQRRKQAGFVFITSLDGGTLEFRDMQI